MSATDFDLESFLKNLPRKPGVYRMLDAKNKVLYVGKAVDLKNRVNSYFSKTDHSPRISLMIRQIDHIEVTVTRSESEALILENNFIKSLSPKYNILFRDDKSYPYIKISAHEIPQISYFRGSLKKPHHYFGPYPNGQSARESIHILQKIFKIRTCTDSSFQNRTRPCLLYQIKRCTAPCTGEISAEDYNADIKEAILFLEGKTDALVDSVKNKMLAAAENLEFERAAKLRDQMDALVKVRSQQFIDPNSGAQFDKDIDILAIVKKNEFVCMHWGCIRKGRKIGDKSFFPNRSDDEDPDLDKYTEAFIAQHYLGRDKPDVIISNFEIPENLKEIMEREKGRKMGFVTNPIGERKVWLNMAASNAEYAIDQKSLFNSNQEIRKEKLRKVLGLDRLERLECFDISHTFGEATIASCVVYDDNAMQPSMYRRFNIKTAKPGDDYQAMREALRRRYSRVFADEENVFQRPDLVVIDGGKGQISATLEIWEELALDVPVIGIAKGPERKPGLEDIVIPFTGEIINMELSDPAMLLLQTVRDEAHRFAITGHRKKRDKARLTSDLDDIPGVGPQRKRDLLTHFGSLKSIKSASVDDIAGVKGISRSLAEKIFGAFH